MEPLRVSHANGISSSDFMQPHATTTRTEADIDAEAAKTQEWCMENLSMSNPANTNSRGSKSKRSRRPDPNAELELVELADSAQGARGLDAASAAAATWTLPDAGSEQAVEAAMAEHMASMSAQPTKHLVDVARRSPGLPPLLAAAQVAADRAPTDALLLVRTGIVQWFRDVLNRPDSISVAAVAHRICFALRAILEAAPSAAVGQLRNALLSGERIGNGASSVSPAGLDSKVGSLSLAQLLVVAVKRHATFTPLVQDASYCLGAFGRHGGSAGASAVLAAGGIEVILEAMGRAPHSSELQGDGGTAIAGLLTCEGRLGAASELGDEIITRRVAERAIGSGALGALCGALQRHPGSPACVGAILEALLAVTRAVVPAFVAVWSEAEVEGQAASTSIQASVTSTQARAARHIAKASLPLLCAALLLQPAPTSFAGGANRWSFVPHRRSRALLEVLSACARLSPQSLHVRQDTA